MKTTGSSGEGILCRRKFFVFVCLVFDFLVFVSTVLNDTTKGEIDKLFHRQHKTGFILFHKRGQYERFQSKEKTNFGMRFN